MSTPDPEGMSLLAKVLGAAAAIVVPIWGARTWLEKRFADKVKRNEFLEFLQRYEQHCRDDREIQAKLFDKLDEVKTILMDKMDRA